MEQVQLTAEIRNKTGKEYCRKVRAQGDIPAVLYGGNQAPIHITINRKSFEHLLATTSKNVLIDLSFDNSKDIHSQTVILKEKQRHQVKGNIIHADFCRVSLEEKLVINVPIELTGKPKGVKEGGILEHHLWEIEIECLPTLIPKKIDVDISHLGIDESIAIKDLTLKQGLKILNDQEEIIASIVVPKEEVVKEAEEEINEPTVIKEKKRPEE